MGGREKCDCRRNHCKCEKKKEFSESNKNWPRWGHDNHNTFANVREHKICKDNIATLTEKWSFEYGVYGPFEISYNAPLVVGDITYMLSSYGVLYAFDVNGNPLAGFGDTVSPFIPGVVFISDPDLFISFALSTPMVFGNYIYTASVKVDLNTFATVNFYINSFDRFTGVTNPNWPVGGVIVPITPSPPHTLQEALETSEITTSMTAVDDGIHSLIFVSTTNSGFDAFQKGAVTAYNLNGNLVWSEIISPNSGAGTGSWSTPSFDTQRKLMFFGTTNQKDLPVGDDSDSLQARNYKTGKLVWNYQYVPNDVSGNVLPYGIYGNPTYLQDRDVGASPNVFDICCHGNKRELVGVCGKDGVYRAFDRKTGALAWQTILSTTATIWGNPSAAYHDGVIYVATSSDIDSSVIGNADPIPYQSYSQLILGEGNPDGSYNLSKAIFVALDACNGKIIWRKEFDSLAFAGASYANGMLFTGTYDGTLRVLDAKTGNILFTQGDLDILVGNITISNGVIYYPGDGTLYAFSPTALCGGAQLNKLSVNKVVEKKIFEQNEKLKANGDKILKRIQKLKL